MPWGRAALACPGSIGTGGLFKGVRDPGCRQAFPDPAVEAVPNGDLPLLASLFLESEDTLGAVVFEVPLPQSGSVPLQLTASDSGLMVG